MLVTKIITCILTFIAFFIARAINESDGPKLIRIIITVIGSVIGVYYVLLLINTNFDLFTFYIVVVFIITCLLLLHPNDNVATNLFTLGMIIILITSNFAL